MNVWPMYVIFFDPRDAPLIEDALDIAGRINIDYRPDPAPSAYVGFVTDTDKTVFAMAHPQAKFDGDSAEVENVVSFAPILETLESLSPSTTASHCLTAMIWCRDQATRRAINAALKGLAGRFVGSIPSI